MSINFAVMITGAFYLIIAVDSNCPTQSHEKLDAFESITLVEMPNKDRTTGSLNYLWLM